MAQFNPSEVVVGAVILLDPEELRAKGAAWTTADKGRAVTEDHFFLIIDIVGSEAVLTPLYSGDSAGTRTALDQSQKKGSAAWCNSPSYQDQRQYWRAPVEDVCEASHKDMTVAGSRNSYGTAGSFVAPTTSNKWRSLYPK